MKTPAAQPAVPDTRRRILDLAEELLLSRGFNAFSYQHIARELGMKPAAIHYHYPTKEALGTAILGRRRGRLRKWCEQPGVSDLSPIGRLEALLAIYETHVANDQRLCVFGSLAAEFNTVPESMRTELRAYTSTLTAWLAEVLVAGRAAGQMQFVGEPVAKAAQVLTTLTGALQVARVFSPKHFFLVVGQLRAELLPTPPPAS